MNPSFRPSRLPLLLLLAIVLLGAAMRLETIAMTVVDAPVRADARIYYYTALNLKRWEVFSRAEPADHAPTPDAYAPPMVPLLISALIEAPPATHMLLAFNIIQALLGTFTIVLAFLLFRPFAGDAVALGAALLTALSPHLISMTTYLLTETLFTFFLISGLASLAIAAGPDSGRPRVDGRWLAVAGGALLGLSALTRATTAYLPWFMLVFLWWQADRRSWWRLTLPAASAALVVVGIWQIRNLLEIGATGDPELMIRSLHHGIYPGFMFQGNPATLGYPYAADPFSANAKTARDVLNELWRRASADPLTYLGWYAFGKPVMLLSWNMIDGMGDIFIYPVLQSPYFGKPLFQYSRLLMRVLHTPLSIAGVAGAGLLLWRPDWLGVRPKGQFAAALAVMTLLYFFLVHAIGAPFPRYGIPLRPLVYGLGLLTLVRAGQWIAARFRTSQPAA